MERLHGVLGSEAVRRWKEPPRDPKVWPAAGDILTRHRIERDLTRRVVGFYPKGEHPVFFYDSRRWRLGMLYCSLVQWRAWARWTTVDRRCPDSDVEHHQFGFDVVA